MRLHAFLVILALFAAAGLTLWIAGHAARGLAWIERER